MDLFLKFAQFWSNGVLECWSNGNGIDIFFFNTPIIHHSITPGPKHSITFGFPEITLLGIICEKKKMEFFSLLL